MKASRSGRSSSFEVTAALALADIEAAAARIAGRVSNTPFVASRTLSEIVGAEVLLKLENLQFTASFKERGAANRLLTLAPAEQGRGIIAMSAGNHAQAVAYHAQQLGIAATIVMPRARMVFKSRHLNLWR